MNKEFIAALDQLEKEKNIPKAQILEAVKDALVKAYKGKNKTEEDNVFVEIDENDGSIEVLHRKNVVEVVEDPETQVSLAEMREYDESYEIDDVADFPFPVEEFSRIAAQTAKQVVVQAIRDAERGMVYREYKDRQGEIITGTVQRMGNGTVYVTIGRSEGVLSSNEQVRGERYTPNSRMKFFIVEVRDSQKGPQIFLSRTHPGLVKKLFELEVPEIRDGIVSIDSLAREAGSRTKMAVSSSDESVDPVGACVGSRGNRVQAVVDELMDEKIDIIPWTGDSVSNISSALAPAQVEKIIFNEEENRSVAVVPDFQLSLAIGKEGQNVRLAARLCGVKIDIKSHSQYHSNAEELIDIPDAALDEDGYYNPEDFLTEDTADETEEPESEEEAAEEYLSPEDYEEAENTEKANAGGDAKDAEPEEFIEITEITEITEEEE
jgi:N utilization substance protein A